jgi:alpha-mannosidase
MLFEKLITIVPLTRANPAPAEITEQIAQATLGSFQALWHPAILSRSATLPVWSPAAEPPLAAPGHLIVVPEPSRPLLPYAWEEQARSSGARVVAGDETRARILARLWDELPDIGHAAHIEADGFFALGLAALYLEMLTAYMHHSTTLDTEHLQKEALAAATAADLGDIATRDDHLRAAFQLIAEARERLYGADIYLLDLCLMDPRAGMHRLDRQLDCQQPISFFASGRTIQDLHARNPSTAQRLRQLLDESKAELLGGEFDEVASTLLPLESHLWQFRHGEAAYRRVLGRAPVVFGRRRFGLARHVLQLLNRLEFLFLTHFCFDDGTFPHRPDPKVRWEAADSSTVEALARIPFAADDAAEFLRFPSKLARTMASDFVATLSFAHWPMPDAPWYHDLLVMSRFAHVFGKFSTLSHYFQSTDAAAISSALSNDDYATPFLQHDHNAGLTDAISRYPRHHRARARLEQIRWLLGVAGTLDTQCPNESDAAFQELESLVEQDDLKGHDGLTRAETSAIERLAHLICPANAQSVPGVLVFNPLSFERRVVIPLHCYPLDARPASTPIDTDSISPLGEENDALPSLTLSPRVEQRGAGGDSRWASLTVPGMGFAWLSSEPVDSPVDARDAATVTDQTIRNEFLEVEIDPVTGGIRSLRHRASRLAQLGQQLVVVGIAPKGSEGVEWTPLADRSGAVSSVDVPMRSQMRARTMSVNCPGPELACLEVEGDLVANAPAAWGSDQVVARFRQTYALGRGQAILRIGVEILEMMPGSLDARVSPWQSYIASRFAWPDPRALLVRGVGSLAESTRSLRPESPYFVEVHGRRHRVVILPGGLPFHQRVGQRMLDTLLVTSTEQCRHFELGIGIDVSNPFQAALDLVAPPAMIARRGLAASSAAWLFHLDARNIVVTSLGCLAAGRRGVRIRLFESAGRYTRGHLRCPHNVAEARLTDFHGQRLATLDTQGDMVKLDLAPREITQLEIEFAVV